MARNAIGFIHVGAWGDLYVAGASLWEVVNEFKDRPIYIIGSPNWLKIIDPPSWPSIKGIVVSKKGWTGELYERDAFGTRWKQTQPKLRMIEFLKGFEATFNLRTESLRFAWAPFLARVPRRHGSAPHPWDFLVYTHRAPWLGKDPLIHERDRMLQVVEAPDRIGQLAERWSKSSGLPKFKEPNRARAEELAKAPYGRYWLLNPTSSRREKAWPSYKYKELFSKLAPLLAEKSMSLRIIGAPTETDWLRETLPADCDPDLTIIQPPSITDLMDVLGGAQTLIANTSSMQFLAPGFDVTTITLMGRGNPVIWGPVGPRDRIVRGTIDPSLAHDIFEQERTAYESISVNAVLAECEMVFTALKENPVS